MPPLTTIDFDKQVYATTVLDLLEARIADPSRAIERVTMPHRLVVRQSSTPRAAARS